MKDFEQACNMSLKHLQHMQHVQYPTIYFYNIKMKQLQRTSETSKTLETYMCNVGEGRPGRSIPAIGVGAGGEPRYASTTSTGRAYGCPWLGRARPKAPRHVRPGGHGGVSDTPDDDEG
jgi:hypothetical protein